MARRRFRGAAFLMKLWSGGKPSGGVYEHSKYGRRRLGNYFIHGKGKRRKGRKASWF